MAETTGESTKTVARQGRISNEKAPATAVTAPGCGRTSQRTFDMTNDSRPRLAPQAVG